MTKKKMAKVSLVVAGLAFCMKFIYDAGAFTEKKRVINSRARRFVRMLSNGKYHECYELFGPTLKRSMSEERFQSMYSPIRETLGKPQAFIPGAARTRLNGRYIKCYVPCACEGGNVMFIVLFDRRMRVEGVQVL
ncbi:MAG: DUF3887 domain-containing protein [Eubacterium sp.]|jgi:hypothetical protein